MPTPQFAGSLTVSPHNDQKCQELMSRFIMTVFPGAPFEALLNVLFRRVNGFSSASAAGLPGCLHARREREALSSPEGLECGGRG